MRTSKTYRILIVGLLGVVAMAVAACNSGDTTSSLTPDEVEEIVAESMAEIPTPEAGISRFEARTLIVGEVSDYLASQPRLDRNDVEDIVSSALARVPQPEPGVTREEAGDCQRGDEPSGGDGDGLVRGSCVGD